MVPGQSINSVFGFRSYFEKTPLSPLLAQLQPHLQVDAGAGRRLHPQRQPVLRRVVPDHPLRRGHAGPAADADPRRRARRAPLPLGNVIFVICEFQIVDRDTEAHNELGEASHAEYKDRQKKAVMRRLQLGGQSGVPDPGDSSGSDPCRFRRAKRQVTE